MKGRLCIVVEASWVEEQLGGGKGVAFDVSSSGDE